MDGAWFLVLADGTVALLSEETQVNEVDDSTLPGAHAVLVQLPAVVYIIPAGALGHCVHCSNVSADEDDDDKDALPRTQAPNIPMPHKAGLHGTQLITPVVDVVFTTKPSAHCLLQLLLMDPSPLLTGTHTVLLTSETGSEGHATHCGAPCCLSAGSWQKED